MVDQPPDPPESGASPEPGWYSNPTGPGRRYWDGEKWTDSYAPDDASEEASASGGSTWAAMTRATKVGLGAAAALAVGSAAPWANSLFITVGGLDGDGIITLIAAAIAAAILFFRRNSEKRRWPIAAGIVAVLALAAAVWDFVQIQGASADFFGEEVQVASAGWGLWMAVVAAAVLAVAAWVRVAEIEAPGEVRTRIRALSVTTLGIWLSLLLVVAVGAYSGLKEEEVCVSSETGSEVSCDNENAVSEEEYADIEAEREAEEAEQAAEEQARFQAESDAAECEFEVGFLLDELSKMNSKLNSGMSLQRYASQVESIQFGYDTISPRNLASECRTNVGQHAEDAANLYREAGIAWQDCLNDPACDPDSIDPKLQRKWAEASDKLTTAESGLEGIAEP